MMTQSVMTQAANLFGSSTGSVTLKGKQSESDFNTYMGNSLKTSQDSMVHTDASTSKKSTVKTNDKQKSIKSDESTTADSKKDSVKADSSAKSDSTIITEKAADTQSGKAKVSKDENAITDSKDGPKDDDQTIVQIEGMLHMIQQAIMDKLNLSPEEFNKLLGEQGMSLEDLIQPENLQQLILANSGESNVLAALTDETLAASMKQLLQTVSDLKAESNLGLTDDQIKSIMKQAEALANAKTETLADTSGVVEQTATQNELANQSETVATVNIAEEGKVSVKSTVETIVQTDASKSVATEQTNTGSQTSSNGDSSKDLNASDHFQTFVDNLVNASQNIQSDFAGEMTQVTNIREIANQIIERIKVTIMPGQTSMELQLNPENLGRVNLSVLSKDGIMTAQFVVQNEISKEAIESQIQTLRDTLQNLGVKVEAIEVTVSTNAFEQNNFNNSNNEEESQKSNSGKHISLDDALAMAEVSDENSSTEDATGVRGSIVDYTA